MSFVDAQIGRLLDAVDAGPNANNAIIVVWGDHGWHLGEKQHWGRSTGWQRSTGVPLIIAPARDAEPKTATRGARCNQAVSLLVPVCLSATHIAYGSIRLEPVFMVLGQSAATAAVLALEGRLAVQAVPYPKLREQLLKHGQRLEAASKPATPQRLLKQRHSGPHPCDVHESAACNS